MNNNIGVNLRTEILKQNIMTLISDSELPVGTVYYILKDLFIDITNAYEQSLTLEQKALEDSSKSEKEENKEEEDKNDEN